MPQCAKCEEGIKEDEDLLVLTAARATHGGDGFDRKRDLAVIHRCCDDGLSLRMEADEDGWRENREFACAHMRRRFNLGHWETRVGDAWLPCVGHNPISACERLGPRNNTHRFVPAARTATAVRTSGSGSARSAR